MNRLLVIAIVCCLSISGCATPPEVKQLSLQQMEYFDSAIEAVSLQSEALILATEKIIQQAKAEIEAAENRNRARMEDLAVNVIPTLTDEQKKETAVRMLHEVAETVREAELAKEKLDADLAKIKDKSGELTAYLKKMKEVHIALDAYIQSEKAGEKVVRDMLNQPSVNELLAKANDLLPRIRQGSEDIQALLSGLQAR